MTDKALFEAVPNFSCGKELAVVEQIADSLRSFKGAALLDYSADADHNRAVYTLAGEAEPLTAALLAACRTARDLIDLRDHQGTHPRIGACDVLPLIPLQNATMQQAAHLAQAVGQNIFDEFSDHQPEIIEEFRRIIPQPRAQIVHVCKRDAKNIRQCGADWGNHRPYHP